MTMIVMIIVKIRNLNMDTSTHTHTWIIFCTYKSIKKSFENGFIMLKKIAFLFKHKNDNW